LAKAPFGGLSAYRVHDTIHHKERRALHYVQGLRCLARGCANRDPLLRLTKEQAVLLGEDHNAIRVLILHFRKQLGRQADLLVHEYPVVAESGPADAPHRLLIAQLKSHAFRFCWPDPQ
jgi:hypothetical protein